MRRSLAISQRLGRDTLPFALRAADAGFDGVFVFDHLVPLGDAHAPALEAAAALGALAGATPLRVGSLVLRATLRAPEVTAALASTLSRISPQPPVIGLGAGDRLTRDETERFGLPFPSLDDRVAQLAETVSAVRARDVTAWVGGMHPRIREIAMEADGWNVWEPGPERLAELTEGIGRRSGWEFSWGGRVLVGKERSDVWLSGSPARIRDRVAQLESLGVDEVVLAPLPATEAKAVERLAEALEDG